MKKILCLLLALSMLFSMAAVLTACSDEEAPADNTKQESNNTATEPQSNPFPDALTNVPAYPVGDIANTTWTLSGGMINEVEMEQEDLDAVLEACGGYLQMAFGDDNSVQLINGAATYDGTYSIVADGYFIDAVFEDYAYYGVFTVVNEANVLIIVNKDAPETALYMLEVAE